ncbi:MAG TPA: hypothetical protein PKV66_00795 [Candidatus Pelethenecus sp.]|nr:hypothetical protein [Candidatus Pelethenecus sp.]
MNSEEALEILFASYNYNGNYQEVIEAREKLEQDLERLEKLDKAIELLKDKLKFELAVYRNGGCTLKHYMNKQTMVSDDTCLRHLDIEEYKLLKEVLCDGN